MIFFNDPKEQSFDCVSRDTPTHQQDANQQQKITVKPVVHGYSTVNPSKYGHSTIEPVQGYY